MGDGARRASKPPFVRRDRPGPRVRCAGHARGKRPAKCPCPSRSVLGLVQRVFSAPLWIGVRVGETLFRPKPSPSGRIAARSRQALAPTRKHLGHRPCDSRGRGFSGPAWKIPRRPSATTDRDGHSAGGGSGWRLHIAHDPNHERARAVGRRWPSRPRRTRRRGATWYDVARPERSRASARRPRRRRRRAPEALGARSGGRRLCRPRRRHGRSWRSRPRTHQKNRRAPPKAS